MRDPPRALGSVRDVGVLAPCRSWGTIDVYIYMYLHNYVGTMYVSRLLHRPNAHMYARYCTCLPYSHLVDMKTACSQESGIDRGDGWLGRVLSSAPALPISATHSGLDERVPPVLASDLACNQPLHPLHPCALQPLDALFAFCGGYNVRIEL